MINKDRRVCLTAFSIFAFVEYFVAANNMFFYWTIGDDLDDEQVVVMKPCGGGDGLASSPKCSPNGHVNSVDIPTAEETKKDL